MQMFLLQTLAYKLHVRQKLSPFLRARSGMLYFIKMHSISKISSFFSSTPLTDSLR